MSRRDETFHEQIFFISLVQASPAAKKWPDP